MHYSLIILLILICFCILVAGFGFLFLHLWKKRIRKMSLLGEQIQQCLPPEDGWVNIPEGMRVADHPLQPYMLRQDTGLLLIPCLRQDPVQDHGRAWLFLVQQVFHDETGEGIQQGVVVTIEIDWPFEFAVRLHSGSRLFGYRYPKGESHHIVERVSVNGKFRALVTDAPRGSSMESVACELLLLLADELSHVDYRYIDITDGVLYMNHSSSSDSLRFFAPLWDSAKQVRSIVKNVVDSLSEIDH